MGIETAAGLAAAAELGTAAAATGAAAAGSLAAAGATAAGAGALGAAVPTALGAAELAAPVLGAELAGVSAANLIPGTVPVAEAIGAMGGDTIGALYSLNGGFGALTPAQSASGFLSSISGIGAEHAGTALSALNTATTPGQQAQQATRPGPSTGPTPVRANQNPSLTQSSGLMQSDQSGGRDASRLNAIGFANGGVVPELLKSLQAYANGGQIRTGSSDVKAGGEIRGPQSEDGRDNQLIKVAGGEGILPVDVMEVKGVPELVQSLIQAFHTPIK